MPDEQKTDWTAAQQVVDELLAETTVSKSDREWARSVLAPTATDVGGETGRFTCPFRGVAVQRIRKHVHSSDIRCDECGGLVAVTADGYRHVEEREGT